MHAKRAKLLRIFLGLVMGASCLLPFTNSRAQIVITPIETHERLPVKRSSNELRLATDCELRSMIVIGLALPARGLARSASGRSQRHRNPGRRRRPQTGA